MKGRVKWWSEERGYGFIEYNDNENVKIVLTGGNSVIIKDHLNIVFDYEENILLEGLLDIYQKNI